MWVLVGGLAFVVAGGAGIYQDRRLNRTGVRVSGTVVDVRWKPAGKDGGQIPNPVVEFRTAGGRVVRTTTRTAGGRLNLAVGTHVPLVHLPNDPEHVNIDTRSGRASWLPVLVLMIGLGLITWAVHHGEV